MDISYLATLECLFVISLRAIYSQLKITWNFKVCSDFDNILHFFIGLCLFGLQTSFFRAFLSLCHLKVGKWGLISLDNRHLLILPFRFKNNYKFLIPKISFWFRNFNFKGLLTLFHHGGLSDPLDFFKIKPKRLLPRSWNFLSFSSYLIAAF